MLSYRKKIPTDSENISLNPKKDGSTINIAEINRIDQSIDNITTNDEKDLSTTNGKKEIDNMLNASMNPSSINPKILVPTTNDKHLNQPTNFNVNQLGGFNQNQMSGNANAGQMNNMQFYPTNQNIPGYVINVQQTIDKDSIIVETLHNQKRFMFYDRNKNFLGGFSIHEFIKYITSNVSCNFCLGVNYDSVTPIIEKYVCNVKKIEKPSKRYVIHMLTYLESPFMGNIETLIKFYTFIHEFETSRLEDELSKLNQVESDQTRDIFNNMMYTLLNHILKIIAILTNKLDPTDINSLKIRNTLLNYSVAIVYRLSKFIRDEINKKIDELNVLNQDLLRIEGIRTTVTSRIDTIQRSIDRQNTEVDILFRHLMFNHNQEHNIFKKNNNDNNDNNDNNNDINKFEILLQNAKKITSPIPISDIPLSETNNMSSGYISDNLDDNISKHLSDTAHIYDVKSEYNKRNSNTFKNDAIQNRSESLKASEFFDDLINGKDTNKFANKHSSNNIDSNLDNNIDNNPEYIFDNGNKLSSQFGFLDSTNTNTNSSANTDKVEIIEID